MMDPSVGNTHWYALYLRSRFEKTTHSELLNKGFDAFLPLVEEIHVWSDRKKRVVEPLFRGYVFVRMGLHQRYEALETPGVVQLVGIKNRPSPIPDEQINWLKLLTKTPDAIRREEYMSVGDRVRVIHGPLAGLEGFVVQVKGRTRVVIALEAIAQAVSVEVDPMFVEVLTNGQLLVANC